MSDGLSLRIAAPGLADSILHLAARGDVPSLPATERLLSRARSSPAGEPDWRTWSLAGAGLGSEVLRRFAAGPCTAAAAGGISTTGVWLRAEPVQLLTALDHLQLAAPVPLPLEPDETSGLLATLNAHLAGTGFELTAADDGGWLCQGPAGLDVEVAEPVRAIGANLRDWLPGGRDGSRVCALANELQMLLHEHPVNERRVARGRPPVNSVWFWGAGVAAAPSAQANGTLVTDDAWLAGLWRVHGGAVQRTAGLADTLRDGAGPLRVACVAASGASDAAAALGRLEAEVFAPVTAARDAGRVDEVLVCDGRRVFEIAARDRWKVWWRPRSLAEVLA